MEFHSRKQRRSRKHHICHLCKKNILPGNEFIYESYKDDGEKIVTLKRHIHCDALLEAHHKILRENRLYDDENIIDTIHDASCIKNCGADKFCDCFFDDNTGKLFECSIVLNDMLQPAMRLIAEKSVKENNELQTRITG